MSTAGSIILQIILIALNAVFACAEIAVLSVNDGKIANMVKDGNKKALRLANLKNQPAKFLATIQVAITLSGFLGSAFAAQNFSGPLVNLIISFGVPETSRAFLEQSSVIVITLILSYLTLVFGELVPKRIAMKKAEKLSLALSGLISFISKLFAPIVALLTVSTNGMLRIFGIDPNSKDEEVTEEEIRFMVEAGRESGAIDEDEKEMIQNVFEFDNVSVGKFATHRTEVSILWTDESVEEWDKTIRHSRHSRYPICDQTVDNVIGVLDSKIYFRLKDKSRENIMKTSVKQPYFVPENVRADVLFEHMKKSRRHFAVVLDEYGGMDGVVTINDLIEQIVGDIDEDDDVNVNATPEIERIDSKTWKINGSALLEDVAEQLDMNLPVDEYETFGGYVFAAYGVVTDDGSRFEMDIDGMHIKVLKVSGRKIEKTLVCLDKSVCGNIEKAEKQ